VRVPLRRLASSKWRRVAVSASAIFRVAFRAALLVGSCVPCHALDVDIRPLGELTLIEVSGDLEKGDDNLFAARTSNVTRAVVTFRSDGGSLLAGIGTLQNWRRRCKHPTSSPMHLPTLRRWPAIYDLLFPLSHIKAAAGS
jgi:hypothetical protein